MSESQLTLALKGIHCSGCVQTIETGLSRVRGISRVSINFAMKQAFIQYDPEQVEPARVIQAIFDLGYSVATLQIELGITGMHCANCAATVERVLNTKVPGVRS